MVLNSLLLAGFLKSIGGVLLAILILLAMVTIHEFGHYVAGKILGFKITEFSVGFGPALFKKRSKKTGEIFALRVIPLGGYCAFDGEDDFGDGEEKNEEPFDELSPKMENEGGIVALNAETEPESAYPEPQGERFNDQAPWKRIIVLIAGATMNYLLALGLILIMFACLGRPMYKVEKFLTAEPTKQTSAQEVVEPLNTLEIGDIIKEIDGRDVYMITDYMRVLDGRKKGDVIPVTVMRDGAKRTVFMVLVADANIENMTDTHNLLTAMGVQQMSTQTQKLGFWETIGDTFTYSIKLAGTVLRSLGELLTGKLSITAMGGPVTTIKVTAQASASGLLSFLNVAALIGVNLAVFNLLPVPALDGCKVIFCIIEWIRKKPVNRKVETIIHLIGIIFLFGFAILVDVLQWLL